jgi:hypothetical protein
VKIRFRSAFKGIVEGGKEKFSFCPPPEVFWERHLSYYWDLLQLPFILLELLVVFLATLRFVGVKANFLVTVCFL